jgi:nitroreductase
MNPLGNVRRTLKSMKPRVLGMRMPRSGRSFYYQFLNKSFVAEEVSVGAGIAAYMNGKGGVGDQYLLRRNIHMLEKGLSMRPRRSTFASGYILPTVDAFLRFSAVNDANAAESRWIDDVLTDYFDATATSEDVSIVAARQRYEGFIRPTDESLPERDRLVPQPANLQAGVVAIDDLVLLAQNRRSVRWFTDEVVTDEQVALAMSVGIEAPTACNRQPFRVIIVDDPAKRHEVARIPMGTKGYADQIPGLMVIVGDMAAFFSERDRHLIYIDGSLAAMGIVFGFEAQGIGTCCINWPDIPEKEREMRRALELGPNEKVVMLLAYGHPDRTGLAPHSARKPADQLSHLWSEKDSNK